MDFEETKKETIRRYAYTVERIDYLIIAIGGAGIYICLETLRFFSARHFEHTIYVKISGTFFVCSVLFNFIELIISKYGLNSQVSLEKLADSEGSVSEVNRKDYEQLKRIIGLRAKAQLGLHTCAWIAIITGLCFLSVFFITTYRG